MTNVNPSDELEKTIISLRDCFSALHRFAVMMAENCNEQNVHQFRVFSRKVHSLSRILNKMTKDRSFKTFGKWIRRTVYPTNMLRDLDVALEYFKERSSTGDVGDEFYRYLHFQRELNCGTVRQQLRQILDSGQFDTFGRLFEDREKYFLQYGLTSQVVKNNKRVQKRALLFDDDPNRKSIHSLRIAIKRHRYLLESIDEDQETINLCKSIQDAIGLIHDREIQLHLFLSWMRTRYNLSEATLKQIEDETLRGFSSRETIEEYVMQLAGQIPMEECKMITQQIVADRDTIYDDFMTLWKSENVLGSTLFHEFK